MTTPLVRAVRLAAAAGLVLGLTACGGPESDRMATPRAAPSAVATKSASPAQRADQAATASVCRVLAVTHGPVTSVEATMADGTSDAAQSRIFRTAIASATELVGRAGLSDRIVGPLSDLTAAWATADTGVANGVETRYQRNDIRDDEAAWSGVVDACAPFAHIR